jgi:hypothetical protein
MSSSDICVLKKDNRPSARRRPNRVDRSRVEELQPARVTRTTVYKVEAGNEGATLRANIRVLAAHGLETHLNLLSANNRI